MVHIDVQNEFCDESMTGLYGLLNQTAQPKRYSLFYWHEYLKSISERESNGSAPKELDKNAKVLKSP